MLLPPLLVPPKSGSVDTWYCDFAFVASGPCPCTGARVTPKQTAIRIMKRVWLALLVVSCVIMFLSFVEFHEGTLWSGREPPPEPLRKFGTDHFIFDSYLD